MANEPISLAINRTFKATPAELYIAFTDPTVLAKWMGPGQIEAVEVVADARHGGEFMVRMQSPSGEVFIVRGQYTEVVPDVRIAHTWQWEGSPTETLVTVEFKEASPGATELTLTHVHFADNEGRDRHTEGWEGCLVKLADLYPTV